MVIDYAQLLKLENDVCQYLYPLRIEGLSNQPLEEVVVTIRIKSKKPIKSVYSPTHNLSIHRRDDYNVDASYEATNVNPERDLVIYYTVSSDDVGINLLTYCDGRENGYFLLLGAPKAHIEQREVVKKNVVFVFGVGYDMNTHFLDKLVQKNHGSSDYVRPAENIEVRVSIFLQRS